MLIIIYKFDVLNINIFNILKYYNIHVLILSIICSN